jgi:hypothetical protein
MVGRDPRLVTVAELEAMGQARVSASATIRAKCLDGTGSPYEVRLCVASTCPPADHAVWGWIRFAPPSEAQREHARRLGARMKSARSPHRVSMPWTRERLRRVAE